MEKREIIEHLRSGVFARIGRSELQGIGVIAIRDIPQGVDPFPGARDGGTVPLDEDELSGMPDPVIGYLKDHVVFREGRWLVPDFGLNAMDVAWYMNHTRTPNVAATETLDFVTLREIRAGEELTVDYDTFDQRREGFR